jgi:subtilisin family serine protease
VKVADIEPDRYVYPCVTQRLPEPKPPFETYVWGLSRISHHEKFSDPLNEYVYNPSEIGDGTTAYVLDTGVRKDHPEFEGRASWGFGTVPGASQTDTDGHGTHVAGTIASKTYGVAKKAKIIDVKVYPDNTGETSASAIIRGLDWAVDHALANNIIGKSVANISSGGGKSTVFNAAVARAVRQGMVVVVAAGNEKVFEKIPVKFSYTDC